jgi:hypothetical protein
MEVKLSPDGRFRFKAFNRSNQNNFLNNDVPYTQGVGLSYRREFNNFSDLFKRKPKEQKPTGTEISPAPINNFPAAPDSTQTKPVK